MYFYLFSLLSNKIELSNKKSVFPQLRKIQIFSQLFSFYEMFGIDQPYSFMASQSNTLICCIPSKDASGK